jgi:hypothetical protein
MAWRWHGNIYSSARTSNRITNDEIKNEKLNNEFLGRTTGDSSIKADEMHVSTDIANVSRSLIFCPVIIQAKLYHLNQPSQFSEIHKSIYLL